MNESLHKYLLSLNCKVVNPVYKKLGGKEIVGHYCKSTSILRKEDHLNKIKSFILENKIDCLVTEGNERTPGFFIYLTILK